MNKLTIFFSHSHKDIEKVRKLREIFESLEFEPLIFHLKCLDDKNDELEDFIKREIDARNVFIYCKSQNAEKSEWVQKELQYITQSNSRRLYTIDIDLPLNQTLVTLLNSLCELIKHNSIFISYSHRDELICNSIKDLLTKNGYNPILRYETIKKQDEHDKILREIVKNGVFLPIITHNYMNSLYCQAELEGALYSTDYGIKPLILPLIVNYNSQNALELIPKLYYYKFYSFDFEKNLTTVNEKNILNMLKDLAY
ncbi:MAG: toll/interleukin-1 receptor domain-containing protein [Corallococcus sp.]|nr:toll/interleukin-1 receptor domain-containing protein [Corallococcus sp.]